MDINLKIKSEGIPLGFKAGMFLEYKATAMTVDAWLLTSPDHQQPRYWMTL